MWSAGTKRPRQSSAWLMRLLIQNTIALMGTVDIWMWYFQENTSSTSTTKVTHSLLKVSMLICAIISLHWQDAVDVFLANYRIFRLFLLFLFELTTVSALRKLVSSPAIPTPLLPFLFLTSFNSLVWTILFWDSFFTGWRKLC